MKSSEIRQTFLDFFQSKQHQIVPSAPMVVKNDPTLMFTNAGMNQFKDWFLGNEPARWSRVADTQKCLRVSGKHNDLEEVGHDTYHHTMFEMLGNWSFGDYFKAEAIAWAWELLTGVYKIPKDQLYVTVFGGDQADGLPKDDEAIEIWKKYISPERILLGSKKDNFWEMGDTGPCGPCSEIHADIRSAADRAALAGDTLVNHDHPQVIEIWNNVFIQFNRMADGKLVQLPSKHVDTGMGFERLCMVLQGKQSNYDTDVFTPLIGEIAKISTKPYGQNKQQDIAMRVIADHVRAVAFAIADGQLPGNAKAGYVIRRILRRAVRYGYSFLDMREPFIFRLVDVLVREMGSFFPELPAQQELIQKVIREEENSFLKTLSTGIQKFQAYQALLKPGEKLSGEFAFEMYDTYGFPIDLTQLMSREGNIEVDMEGFSRLLEEQKNRSRQDAAVETADWVELVPGAATEFVGYDEETCQARIIRYRKVSAKGKTFYQIVLDRTPFYAESGGQAGDSGTLHNSSGTILITDTHKENNLIVHLADELPEALNAPFTASISASRRRLTANNHSATHLLHYALRKVLGTHVEQKGSFVGPDYLRFDFAHFQKLSPDELRQVERLANQQIRANFLLDEKRAVSMEQARDLSALAFFGEKYGEKVRVIGFGDSVELCGGTHVPATGQIGLLHIVAESAIAAGVRRIEAITADKAEQYYESLGDLIEEIKLTVKNPVDPLRAIRQMAEQNAGLRKQIEQLNREKTLLLKEGLIKQAQPIPGGRLIAARLDLDPVLVKDLAFALRSEMPDLIFVAAGQFDGKPSISVMVSDGLITSRGLHAGNLVKELARNIQGGGGGQAGFATAGGKNADGIALALQQAESMLAG